MPDDFLKSPQHIVSGYKKETGFEKAIDWAKPIPKDLNGKNITFGDFKLNVTLDVKGKERTYKRTQMEFWCRRIKNGLGLRHPVRLHIIRHSGEATFPGHKFEETNGRIIRIPMNTLGQYRWPQSAWTSEHHHIVVRLRDTPRETLYVLAHELQHAAQCEHDYGLDGHRFVTAYKREVGNKGYRDASFEIDARRGGVEWVERILDTEPLEVLHEGGSALVPVGTVRRQEFEQHDRFIDHLFDELVDKNQKQLEDELKDAKEKSYKLYMGERAEEETADPLRYTFKWDPSKVVGKNLLTNLISDEQAERISDNLR